MGKDFHTQWLCLEEANSQNITFRLVRILLIGLSKNFKTRTLLNQQVINKAHRRVDLRSVDERCPQSSDDGHKDQPRNRKHNHKRAHRNPSRNAHKQCHTRKRTDLRVTAINPCDDVTDSQHGVDPCNGESKTRVQFHYPILQTSSGYFRCLLPCF